jgi:hypothetical protein
MCFTLHIQPQFSGSVVPLKPQKAGPPKNVELPGDQARILDAITGLGVPEIYDHWHQTIANYTQRRLTKYQNTLPKLSGLARIVSSFVNHEYVVGMWAHDLQRSLAWKSTETHVLR